MTRTYVIGHVNPDSDTISSAMGYAWLLRERDGEEVVAARAGPLNPQTTWVLKRLGLESPLLLNDASPRFESVSARLDTTTPDRPFLDAWGVAPFRATARIRDSLNRILREEGDDFWVVDENGLYVGVCRQRGVLNPPRLRLILVDHNEPSQAVGALGGAGLGEV